MESTHKPSSVGTIFRHSWLDQESRVLSKQENICCETVILSGEVIVVYFDYFLGYTSDCCNSNGEGDDVKNMNKCMLLLLSIIVVLSASCSSNSMRPFAEKFANISRNSGRSCSPTVLLDKFDNPHIFWLDGTYTESAGSNLMYVKWSGQNWVIMDGTKYDPETGNAVVIKNRTFLLEQPSFAIDKSGNAHVSWGDSIDTHRSSVIYYMKSDGSNWITANGELFEPGKESGIISDPEKSSWFTATVIDDKGNPHISWFEDHKMVCSGFDGEKWTTINTPVGDNPYLNKIPHFAINPSGDPYVAWMQSKMIENKEFNDVHLITWNGAEWLTINGELYNEETGNSNVSNNIDFVTYEINLVSDSSNNPHLFWLDISYDNWIAEKGNNLPDKFFPRYIKWDGSNWVTEENTVNISSTSIQNFDIPRNAYSFALDDNGSPHLAWRKAFTKKDTPITYIKWNGSNWVCVDGSVYNPEDKENTNPAFVQTSEYADFFNNIVLLSNAIDSNGKPHLVWQDANKGSLEIYYLKWDGENWVTLTNNSE
ncbi:MAG: hypothetical protein KAH30_01280 [Caldisericia bacterium]|nr:hypothetical protein [Caldisericia bacterium]